MKQPAHTSTQKFIEMVDIKENIVLLQGGNACIVIRVTATNFALLSREEQDGKMFAYASLLNSLSSPVQILVKSKKVQILPYLKLLDTEIHRAANPRLTSFIQQYRNFVENMVTVSTVLDKQFYMILSYSSIEAGLTKTAVTKSNTDSFHQSAKKALQIKAESIIGLIGRLGLRAFIVDHEELVKLFYDIYNQGEGEIEGSVTDMAQSLAVKRQKSV